MLVPIESQPVCDFLFVNNGILTHIFSRTVFQLLHSIGQIIAVDKGVPLVNAFVFGIPLHRHNSYYY